MENGIEKLNVRVILASKISKDDCTRLNPGYLIPARMDPTNWKNRVAESNFFASKAGEILYRIKN